MALIQRIIARQPIYLVISTICLAVRDILSLVTLRCSQPSNASYTDIAVMPKRYSLNHYNICIGLRTIKYSSNHTNIVLITIPTLCSVYIREDQQLSLIIIVIINYYYLID